MSGWKRLYVFVAVLVAAPLLVAFVVAAFNAINEERFPVYACHLSSWDASAVEAKEYLRNGIPVEKINSYAPQSHGPNPACVEGLERIVSGEAWQENVLAMLKASAFGAALYFAFFAMVYVIGRGVGWVWRGFFPPKA